MKADYLSYKRAAGVSLLGLALQLVMGLALLIYAVISKDHAATTGAVLVLMGGAVWLTLAVLFDQHRRERIEALEAEALNQSGARDASVFAEQGDELRVASRRLAWMHTILVPIASLLLASALIGLGLVRLLQAQKFTDDSFKPTTEPVKEIVIGLVLAVVGFVFARYVGGMAKQKVWANLRGGAGQSVAAAIVGVVLAGGAIGVTQKWPLGALIVTTVIPVMMLTLGAEIVLNFLLSVYRPRKPGEVPRPAMDSRILSFIAAPDRIAESLGGAINYQFGFDVTGSWFYQLLSRSLPRLVAVGVLVVWAMTCLTVVNPNEQGLRVRLGRPIGETLGPGPYVKLPWPIERIERTEATSARVVNLGGDKPALKGPILWTEDHKAAEHLFAVRPSADELAQSAHESEKPGGGLVQTAEDEGIQDVMLVAAEVPLYFAIEDVKKFREKWTPEFAEGILKAIGRREVTKFLATQSIDQVLGRGRDAANRAIQERVQRAVDRMDVGLRVLSVGIEGAHPPRDTAESFEEVVGGQQKREGAIEKGRGEANAALIAVAGSVELAGRIIAEIEALDALKNAGQTPDPKEIAQRELAIADLLAQAGGSAAGAIHEARAQRWERHMDARGRAERHVGQVAAYKASPRVYAAQVYFDTIKEAMRKSRVYITTDDSAKLEIRVNLEDRSASGNLFDAPKKAGE